MARELPTKLQIVCWGITQKCNLSCTHCDRDLGDRNGNHDLSIEECFRVIDGILEAEKPAIVLTGGEPLLRDCKS
ncbi:radical SAM protein [Chloroflexota bacterium]